MPVTVEAGELAERGEAAVAGVAVHRVGAGRDRELVVRAGDGRVDSRSRLARQQSEERQADPKASAGRGHRTPPRENGSVNLSWSVKEPRRRIPEEKHGDTLRGAQFKQWARNIPNPLRGAVRIEAPRRRRG